MSGGHFEYNQWKIEEIANDIEQEIKDSGQPVSEYERKEKELWSPGWYEKYPEDLTNYEYPKEILDEFKKGVEYLRKAYVYTQRIDWLLSGDDGEESFISRLKDDLDKL